VPERLSPKLSANESQAAVLIDAAIRAAPNPADRCANNPAANRPQFVESSCYATGLHETSYRCQAIRPSTMGFRLRRKQAVEWFRRNHSANASDHMGIDDVDKAPEPNPLLRLWPVRVSLCAVDEICHVEEGEPVVVECALPLGLERGPSIIEGDVTSDRDGIGAGMGAAVIEVGREFEHEAASGAAAPARVG